MIPKNFKIIRSQIPENICLVVTKLVLIEFIGHKISTFLFLIHVGQSCKYSFLLQGKTLGAIETITSGLIAFTVL